MSFRFPLVSAPGVGSTDSHAEFVYTDIVALADHMSRCADAHDGLFALRSGLQKMHGMAAGRIVTMGFLALALAVSGIALLSVA
ncbi:MAG: hypothetical protein JWQ03_985 [Variovorax sp.]|nr:hypothetical protein [Variovorax sp.]